MANPLPSPLADPLEHGLSTSTFGVHRVSAGPGSFELIRSDFLFTIVHASPRDACEVTQAGWCISDGAGSYLNNERCTIRVNFDMELTATEFSTEPYVDFIRLNSPFSAAASCLATNPTASDTWCNQNCNHVPPNCPARLAAQSLAGQSCAPPASPPPPGSTRFWGDSFQPLPVHAGETLIWHTDSMVTSAALNPDVS
jgi:hypothetical protein